jgi:alpha-beta hydrolase superfamily lysophospholipase
LTGTVEIRSIRRRAVCCAAVLPRRAFLGAELGPDAEAFTPAGLQIAGIVPGGMAERAGVAPGDTVTAIAELPVRTLAELGAALRRAGALPSARVDYVRGGEPRDRIVEVARLAREQLDGAELDYGELSRGDVRLRTIATRVPAPRAIVLAIQGIACESIDGAEAPLARLAHGWARAGISSLRVDKRGAGDSEGGPCGELDFATELADAAAALELAQGRARGLPVIVFGHSVGGIIAAALAGDHPVAGVITFGAPASRWLECLADTTRRQLEQRGAPPDEIHRQLVALAERARSVGLNGRSAAFHAQLDAIDPAALWSRVRAPVAVVRGEHDWVVRDDDQARIAALVSGPATIIDLPGLDHVMGWHPDRDASIRDYGAGRFDDAIVHATVEWIARLWRL